MKQARKLDTASAVAALLGEGDDRLVVTTETKHIDVERIHERTGRAKPIKVERRDGTIDEVNVETVLEGLVRKNQVEALAENLPTCACCGKKVAPVDMRPRPASGKMRSVALCKNCPRCACGAALAMWTMTPSVVEERGGRPPTCIACHRAAAARHGQGTESCQCGAPLMRGSFMPSKVARRNGRPAMCKACARVDVHLRKGHCLKTKVKCAGHCGAVVGNATAWRARRDGLAPMCRTCSGRRSGAQKRRLSDEQAKQIVERSRAGESGEALAKEFGCTRTTVSRLRRGMIHAYGKTT